MPADTHRALLIAAVIVSFVLGLFAYWFGIADRYIIFLYGHTAHGIPLTQPFDEITSSRYWMAGLVVSGAVLTAYTGFCLIAGRRGFRPPTWQRIWVLCAFPLLLGIPAITMTLNSPTLPLELALACVGATLIGLALALWPGAWAAERPADLFRLILDGAGLLPPLFLLRTVELPARGISISVPLAWALAIASIPAAFIWWWGVSRLSRRIRSLSKEPDAVQIYASGLCSWYLLLPLAHYVLGRSDYRYITTASNFFAFDPLLQLLIFAITIGMTWGVDRWRRRQG